MKKLINFLLTATTLAMLFVACQKVKDLPFYDNGTAVTLSSSVTSVAPAPADSLNNVISFAWTDPAYASDSSTFKYVLEIDSAGRNFSNKITKEVIGQRNTSLTGKDLNVILLNYGFAPGTACNLDFRVLSSYGNNNEQYKSNVINVMVTPYGDSSVLTSSVESAVCELNTASQKAVDFNWSASFNGYSGTVNYVIEYDSVGKNFAAPKEIAVGSSLYTKALTQGELNETALNSGVAGGEEGKIEYRVKASTSFGASVYSNVVAITIQSYFPLLRFYMPGGYQNATGNGNDWDPGTAPEFVRDLRSSVFNDMYYMYIYLPAGAKFKITQGRSWDVNYGGSGGVLSAGGADIGVGADGFYRISINRKTMQYDIREGRMGFVGGATGAGWNPPNVFPAYALGNVGTNLFLGVTDLAADGWKLIDNDQWNNGSNAVDETRSYGSSGSSGSELEVNGANFPNVTSAGRYRVIWDGRNVDKVVYEMTPATEMRIVGDGIDGVNAWDPGASPQMTYMGKGKWQLTLKLLGGKDIKFLAGNAWGAFDYEDNSGGSNATGVARKTKWDGGDNFKTPAAGGTYTVVLDEQAQTVTINP
ncbi:SusE domain-containing protein [Foetidibacter luteolus]|uniref:SusE domain-containing protein n=1 Tax=Foetidibacter luteolus TaxID=2608880 RepID=UPI00129B7175|nr:SusE domain-containing protein [Foetidibacter luteolus]